MTRMVRSARKMAGVVLAICSACIAASPYAEVGTIAASGKTKCKRLSYFCLDGAENLLVCDKGGSCILKLTPEDELLDRWSMPFAPEVVGISPQGVVYVAGGDQLAQLGPNGTIVKLFKIPQTGSRATCAGIAVTDTYCFVTAYGRRGFSVYRVTPASGQTKEIMNGLRGCCGQMGITTDGGKLFVAENARHQIHVCDFDGKKERSFGKRGRTDDTFGGCCEPKYLCVSPEGDLLTAESYNQTVKRFSMDGEFLGVCGDTEGKGGCLRVTVACTQDGKRIYIIDDDGNLIRVLAKE